MGTKKNAVNDWEGYGSQGRLAASLIRDCGWCPRVVSERTGLSKTKVEAEFRKFPYRYAQWYQSREGDILLANHMIDTGRSREEVQKATGWSEGSVKRQFFSRGFQPLSR